MSAEHDSRAELHWQLGTTDASLHHVNLSHEELMKLQLDIIRNFTRLYGSAAIGRGQLQGDILRHAPLLVLLLHNFYTTTATTRSKSTTTTTTMSANHRYYSVIQQQELLLLALILLPLLHFYNNNSTVNNNYNNIADE